MTIPPVLIAGLVALVLNQILPEEDEQDDDDVVEEVVDVEAQPHTKEGEKAHLNEHSA